MLISDNSAVVDKRWLSIDDYRRRRRTAAGTAQMDCIHSSEVAREADRARVHVQRFPQVFLPPIRAVATLIPFIFLRHDRCLGSPDFEIP